MASRPIMSWEIEGGKMGAVTDFIFLGSEITVDGDCSHEIKRCLLLGRKAMTNIDSVLKSRNKVPIGAWVYFWAFYLVLLVYVSVFVPIPYCVDDVAL